jgi:hypothetical protein
MKEEKKFRRSFVLKSVGIAAAAAIAGWFGFAKKMTEGEEEKKETVKMLTRDGKLVEIDKKLLASSGNKISKEELQQWIKK